MSPKEADMKIKTENGFTLVEIMIVVAIIGLLATIAIPSFMRARQNTQTNTCINNLRLLDWAKDQWAIEQGIPFGNAVAVADLRPYMKQGVPYCPICGTTGEGDGYTLDVVGSTPQCNQFNLATHPAFMP